MKKFLTLAILSLSSMAFVPSIEAKSNTVSTDAAAVAAAPQINVRIGRGNRYQRRVRVTTTTRTVRRGRNLVRETYRTTYRPNGAVNTRLINRVVIRRY